MSAPRFIVNGGEPCTLAELLAANEHDAEVCEWAACARPGDALALGHGCVERVA